MATREERTITVDVISASDLKKVRKFSRQDAYAVAYIYPRDRKSTKVDPLGGLNPVWNSKLDLVADKKLLQQKQAAITLEVHCHSTFGSKLVGAARIPLADLSKDIGAPHFKTLELSRPSSLPQGSLTVSVILGETRTVQSYQAPLPQSRFGGSGVPNAYAQAPQGYYPAGSYAQQPYGYQQQPYGYPQQGYGYPQQGYYAQQQQPPRRAGGGLGGAGLGLGAGLLGGFLVGDALGNLGGDGGDFGGGDFGGDF